MYLSYQDNIWDADIRSKLNKGSDSYYSLLICTANTPGLLKRKYYNHKYISKSFR